MRRIRHVSLSLSALLATVSLAACSSGDSSSSDQPQQQASELNKNGLDPKAQPAPQPAPAQGNPAQGNPAQQTPVQQSPVQQNGAGYFEANNGTERILIPSSARIQIQFRQGLGTKPDENVVIPGNALSEEQLPVITAPVYDVQGRSAFAANSVVVGNLKMSAPRAIFNVTGIKVGSITYSMLSNAEVVSEKMDEKSINWVNVLIGAGAGAGIGTLIDQFTGTKNINWYSPVLGALVGGAAASFFQSTNEVVKINPNTTAVLIPGPR